MLSTTKVLKDLESTYLWTDTCSSEQSVVNTGKNHKGICILFEGVCYLAPSSFAKEYGFNSVRVDAGHRFTFTWAYHIDSSLECSSC